jgi:hypothetical protein
MKRFSLPKTLLLLNLLAVGLMTLLVQVQNYRIDVVTRNNALFTAEKSYFTGCMNEATDKTDAVAKWSCHMLAETYRRDMQTAVGLEPVVRIPLYDSIIDKLDL